MDENRQPFLPQLLVLRKEDEEGQPEKAGADRSEHGAEPEDAPVR